MATSQTTNLHLTKPDYTERADIAVINGNMDLIDANAGGTSQNIFNLQEAVGIVCNGKKTSQAAAIGQYVILKNSTISGCADGLYTAKKTIPANTNIDSTYLQSVSGGGLNALSNNIASQYSDISFVHFNATSNQVVTLSVSNSLRSIMFVCGNSSGVHGEVVLASSGSGAGSSYNSGGETTGLTFDMTTSNKIKITFANPAHCVILIANGSVSVD